MKSVSNLVRVQEQVVVFEGETRIHEESEGRPRDRLNQSCLWGASALEKASQQVSTY